MLSIALPNQSLHQFGLLSPLIEKSDHVCVCVCVCALVSSVPGGAFPADQREHEPASPLVVHRSDHHTGGHRNLADEAPQELLRGQKAGVKLLCVCVCVC